MGKDSANRWLEEIEDVYYLVRASGLEGDTALAHPYVGFFIFSLLKLSTTLSGTRKVKPKTQPAAWKMVARHTGFKTPALRALRFFFFYVSNHLFKTDNGIFIFRG